MGTGRSLSSTPGWASSSILSVLALGLFILAMVVTASRTAAASGQEGLIEGWDWLPPAEVESRLPDTHPANYYAYAARLWKDAESDKAVFWLYVGQLRYRFLLLTEPNADPSGDPALFGSLHETIGGPINLYAGSDTSKWVDQINSALQWDESNRNGFTSKSKYRKQWEEARAGLVKLRDDILAHADEIRNQRAQQGIGEVGMRNGVYVEERRARMPADWPALEPATSLDRVVGAYMAELRLGHSLFFSEGSKAIRAATFEISKAESGGMLLVAKKGDAELVRRTVSIRERDGAILFEGDFKPDDGSSCANHQTVHLRVNAASDLVVESDVLAEGMCPGHSVPVHEVFTFWYRAARVSN